MPSDKGIGKHSEHIIQAESKSFHLWTLSCAEIAITPAIGVCVCVCMYVDGWMDGWMDR